MAVQSLLQQAENLFLVHIAANGISLNGSTNGSGRPSAPASPTRGGGSSGGGGGGGRDMIMPLLVHGQALATLAVGICLDETLQSEVRVGL